MDEWWEGAIKSCDAGTDAKRIRSLPFGEPGVDVDRKGSFGDIPVPPVMEEIVVVVHEEKLTPQERVQQRTVEHVSAPQFRKDAVGEGFWPRLNEGNTALASKLWSGSVLWKSQCPNTGKRASR